MNILILDDEPAIGKSIMDYLSDSGYQAFSVTRVDEAITKMGEYDIDLLFLDIELPELDGLSFLKNIKPIFPDMLVIMISGQSDHQTIISSMRLGAIDFLVKPFKLSDVQLAITRTENFLKTGSQAKDSPRLTKLKSILGKDKGLTMIYHSKQMAEVINLASMVAKIEEMPVLISGESGTGKELVAKYIHQNSYRYNKRFIATNCASIPNELFESEFFGHIKGSFTGAIDDQAGLFELANDGMLFLDEISEMDIRHQAKLLRVLESKEIKRIGGKKILKVETRVLAATNKNLKQLAAENHFRNDLYHRLSVFEIHIPPLRERPDDIAPLVQHFLDSANEKYNTKVKGFKDQFISILMKYDFPGNIRELKNIVEKAIIVSKTDVLNKEDLENHLYIKRPPAINNLAIQPLPGSGLNIEAHEKQLILLALEKTGNNKHSAARLLGLTPQALRRRMEKYDMLFYN
jgi:two-component system, NtrC family, response regulator AtoC